jgi:hypothetical protein
LTGEYCGRGGEAATVESHDAGEMGDANALPCPD